MPDTPEVKADAVATAPPDLNQIRADALSAGKSVAAEVIDLCMLAGCPDMAGELLKANLNMADIRAKLLTAKSEAAGAETSSAITPDAGGEKSVEKSTKGLLAERKRAMVAARTGGK